MGISCPKWAQSIADQVAVLVRDPVVLATFRRHVTSWAERYCDGWTVDDAEEFALMTKRRGVWKGAERGQHITHLIPINMPNEQEKYVILSVIHDECVDGCKIDPWWSLHMQKGGRLSQHDHIVRLAYLGASLDFYDGSVWQVPDSSRVPIENILLEILNATGIGPLSEASNGRAGIVNELRNPKAVGQPDTPDTGSDTRKKSRKFFKMNSHAANCAKGFRLRKQQDPSTTIEGITAEYDESHKGERGARATYLRRIFNDNPDQLR